MVLLARDTYAQACREAPSYLLAVADMIARYATGRISYEAYQAELSIWWEANTAAWQADDFARLFRLICLMD